MGRTDEVGNCSITVHLRQTPQVSGSGIVFEACRVGSVNQSDGRMILNWNMGELSPLRPSDAAKQLTQKLSDMIFPYRGKAEFAGKTEKIVMHQAITTQDGTCRFTNLKEGAWLLHASDCSNYGRIEDTLLAIPAYVQQEQTWIGPVRDVDVWPKGEILSVNISDEPVPVPLEVPVPTVGKETEPTAFRKSEDTVPEPDTVPRPGKTRESETEKKKDSVRQVTQTSTQQMTHPVQTLDDTPLSGLVCAFLGGALVIGMILLRWKKKRKCFPGGHLALLLCAGWILALASGTGARAQEGSNEAFELALNGERKLVFVNQSPDAPCLTVSKEVQDAASHSRAPEGDLFAFCLSLNGERASGIRYRVFDASGAEWVDLAGSGGKDLVIASSAVGDPVFLRTGRDGTFYLKGGQTALFEDVSAGEVWEVTEQDMEHYERIYPASSATISGTVEQNGSTARFVNRYLPEEVTDPARGILEITKKILWPEEIALPVRGSFRVRVVVDGKPLREAVVEYSDLDEGSFVRYGTTDENGEFEIMGNQRASIPDLPSGADASVEEIDDPGDLFRPSGSISWKGAVSAKTRVTLTNRLAAFTVTKKLRSGDRDHSFSFRLLRKDGSEAGNVPYFLADESGRIEGTTPVYTDPQGKFSLRSGQKAVFTGIAEGSSFQVREEKALGYRQVIPEKDGYPNILVRNGVPELLFENEKTAAGLFAPSAGGSGICVILILAFAGMGTVLVVWIRGRKRLLSV